jgi:hypothetical protein
MATQPAPLPTIFIHHRHDNVESGPAEPAGSFGRKKLFRLKFIPVVYATPTYDDIVIAERDPRLADNWSFECPQADGTDADDVYERGGRYAMIVDFIPGGDDRGAWFPGRSDIVSALAVAPTDGRPGRVCFAIPDDLSPEAALTALREAHPGFRFAQLPPQRGRRSRRVEI